MSKAVSDFEFPDVEQFIERAGLCDQPVLIHGETGTGKSHIGFRIHERSSRASGPFIHVNCAAIHEGLFERELFGHVRGAFTDAKDSREGLIEAANRGTLFLDEIGELPLCIQPKLLSALENGRIRRLGSPRETRTDVRVITATNCEIDSLLANKQFRPDLFYRIAVLRFRTVPLRERCEHLPGLIDHLLRKSAAGGAAIDIDPEALQLLRQHSWPGNIRELENTLGAALAMTDAKVLRLEHLASDCSPSLARSVDGGRRIRYTAPADEATERARILDALRAENANRTRAARRLGMARSTLWVKMIRYGLDQQDANDEADRVATFLRDGISVTFPYVRTPVQTLLRHGDFASWERS
jgi:DNA-binding NtrC family response regulator